MRRNVFIVGAVLIAAGFFTLGCLLGQRKSARTITVAGDFIRLSEFNHAYGEATHTLAVIAQLDSGQIEDAKYMLQLRQNGCIVTLDSLLQSTPMSADDILESYKVSAAILAPYGSPDDMANRTLARISQYRTQQAWTYEGKLPHSKDPETEAHLAAILQRASASQN